MVPGKYDYQGSHLYGKPRDPFDVITLFIPGITITISCNSVSW